MYMVSKCIYGEHGIKVYGEYVDKMYMVYKCIYGANGVKLYFEIIT